MRAALDLGTQLALAEQSLLFNDILFDLGSPVVL